MSGIRPLVAGNWKMNAGDPASALDLALAVAGATAELAGLDRVDVAVCPPFTAIATVAQALSGTRVAVGAQDLHWEPAGAYTGEVSAPMLAGLCRHVIVGHSERRHLFGETDEQVRLKLQAALAAGLCPVLCVGETLDEHDLGRTAEVVGHQLDAALQGLPDEAVLSLDLAYEPVWAIGTGRAATPEHAAEVCRLLHSRLAERFSAGDRVRVLYGGSVSGANAQELMGQEGIDGALVGGASLKARDFAEIVAAAAGAAVPERTL
ncbi:MAG: triose-phosphate isomerase [Candidatus Dormibacteria bacterium]